MPHPFWMVANDVQAERCRQDKKFGESHMPSDNRLLAVLMEEVGEVAKCLCEGSPTDELRLELVQVAAVAVRWLEILDINR